MAGFFAAGSLEEAGGVLRFALCGGMLAMVEEWRALDIDVNADRVKRVEMIPSFAKDKTRKDDALLSTTALSMQTISQ